MKDLRCLAMLHRYIKRRTSDGVGSYLECRRCGKIKDAPDGLGGARYAGGNFGGGGGFG